MPQNAQELHSQIDDEEEETEEEKYNRRDCLRAG